MGTSASKGLMRDAAIRLVNFDPNFDVEPEPLPRPWLHHRMSAGYMGYYNERPHQQSGAYSRQAPAVFHTNEFAYPQLPRGRSHPYF